MPTQRQNDDGSWSDAKPLGPQGWFAKLEFKLRDLGFTRIANAMGRWDERKLDK